MKIGKQENEGTLNSLLELKVEHSKLDIRIYNEMKLQNYLKTDGITVHEAKYIFKYRVSAAKYENNFGDNEDNNNVWQPH